MPSTSKKDFDPTTIGIPLHFPYRIYSDPDYSLRDEFVRHGEEISLRNGNAITTDEMPGYAFFVLDGSLASYMEGPDGSLIQSAYYLNGGTFLELSALSGMPTQLRYVALEDTKLIRIPSEKLKRLMMADERIFDAVTNSISHKLYATREQQRGAKMLDVRERIYIMLLGFAKDRGESDDDGWIHINWKLTQQCMSDMLSVNRVTVNTALQNLYEAELVRKSAGFYSIKDPAGIIQKVI